MALPYASEDYRRVHAEIAGKPTTGRRSPLSRRTIRQAEPRYWIAETGRIPTATSAARRTSVPPSRRSSPEAAHRTKEFDRRRVGSDGCCGLSLADALVDGESYASTLNPPPGQGRRHPAR
jgi:hypothetical protein